MTNRILAWVALLVSAQAVAGTPVSCPTTDIAPDTALPAAAVGASYNQVITADGSSSLPYGFAITSGLPAGSGLDLMATAAATANLTGTSAHAGNFLVTITATDANGCSGGRTYAFDITRGDQTIGFTSTAPANAQVGGTPYTVAATASSSLPVSFSIDAAATAVCSIAGTSVSFQHAGTCVIDADQAGDADWNAAQRAQQSFAVGRANQTISFTSTAPTNAQVGGTTYTVAATATSALAVAFTIDPSASAVCSISGSTVSFIGAGTCVIDADQAGDADWNAAPRAQQSFAVGRSDQTISFTSTAPANAQVGGATYAVAATATSGLAVTFTIDPSANTVCSIAGSTVSFIGTGTCVIDADQAGNANYNAAPRVQQSFAVGRSNQTISFTSTAPANAQVGGAAYTVAATATSGLAVTLTIDPSASTVCSISGSTVSFIGTGNCVIDADQAGNASYNPAPRVQQSFAVGKGDQTISFTSTAPANAAVGAAAYTVTATATSALPVTLTVDPSASGVCSIAGASVTFQHVGNCVLNADQGGNANWNPAPRAQQSFAVGKGAQTIAFTSTAPANAKVGGAAYTVAATASSALAVTFSIDPSASAVCSIAGASVSFIGAGSCVIDADQAGNADYIAAPRVQQSFVVGKGDQTIGFTSTAPANAQVGGATYTVAATATSGLAVTFTVDPSATAVCSIAGATVSFIGAGSCVIDADQAGNVNWNAAPRVQQSFAVAKANQTVSFTSTAPANAQVGGATYAVAATATSGLAVALTIDPSASAVCSIAGSTVSFISAGTCVINADQAGNANYNAAPRAQQSFAVGKGDQMINFASAPPANAVVNGAAYVVAATATSGLAVTITVDPSASGVCSIAGTSVTFQHAGVCTLNADQAGNANYNAAPRAQQAFVVGKGAQAIAFGSVAPVAATVGGAAYNVVAIASSGLPVALSIDASSGAVCTISGSSVSFIGAGTCVINANQSGNADYNAAPQTQQSFAVGKASQTIAFTSTPPAGAVAGGASYTVAATASSGLTVTLTIDPSASAVCSISGSTVSFIGAGTCVIDANQPGDASWNAAAQVQQSFAVGKGSQTIAFTSTAPNGVLLSGTPYDVSATASSGLPVTFTIDPSASAVCSISGSTVSYLAAGVCVINADQAGDANWNAAPQAQQSFTITDCITLSVGQVVLGSMPGGANLCVRNTDGASAEFMYLPINMDTATDSTLSLTGNNIVAVAGPPNPISPERPAGVTALAPLQTEPATDAFEPHAIATPPAFPDWHQPSAADLVPARITATPLVVGQLLDLNASAGDCGATLSMRKGRVEAITTAQSPGQPLLYAVQEVVETTPGAADWHAPVPGGFTQGQFQNLIDAFVQAPPGSTPTVGMLSSLKTGAMDMFTNNFGAVSDIDGNGGVIVFFTPALNGLAPPASSLVAPALFQARDLYNAATCPGSNQGEIIYMQVPDPTGVVNSNVRTVSSVYGSAGPALVHHFEHLVNASRRLYFNAAPLEKPWLDEALAWSAQELVFFNASVGLVPRSNIVVTNLTTGPSASIRVADFNTYENPMYGHWRTWFYQLSGTNANKRLGPLRQQPYSTSTSPDVHENIAPNFAITHAFLRYALDRKNTGDAALLQALVNSNQVGMANLQAVFGIDANEWARDFLVAMYTDDSGVSVSPEYTIPSWSYRSLYIALNGTYQLAVDPLSNGVTLNFGLGYGGGARYTRFGVAAGQDATVTLTQGGTAPGAQIRTALVRTK